MHPLTRGSRSVLAFGVGLFGILTAACGPYVPDTDYGVEPRTSVRRKADTTITTFQYDPAATATHTIAGAHKVTFPAGSICDPATTAYGAAESEKPCTPLATNLTITAHTWRDADGRPQVEFSPDLRFTADDKKPVILELQAAGAVGAHARIMYCADLRARRGCVDESLTDPELQTRYNAKTGALYRRVKHFSGYNIAAREEPRWYAY